METGFLFHLYYPKSKHIFLIDRLLFDLTKELYQRKDVLGVLFWSDQFKGENISCYVKCLNVTDTHFMKLEIEDKVNQFFQIYPEIKGNEWQEDYFFMDYPTNHIVFNSYRFDKKQLEILTRCMTYFNASLTIIHMEILKEKDEWNAINKIRLSFTLLVNLFRSLRRDFEIDISQYLTKLYCDFIDHYKFDTVTQEYHTIVNKGHAMYDRIEEELVDLKDDYYEIISRSQYEQWMSQTKSIVSVTYKNNTDVYLQVRDIYILTCLELGLGPDTGLMVLIWIQKMVNKNNKNLTH